jgi:hypothetical protein
MGFEFGQRFGVANEHLATVDTHGCAAGGGGCSAVADDARDLGARVGHGVTRVTAYRDCGRAYSAHKLGERHAESQHEPGDGEREQHDARAGGGEVVGQEGGEGEADVAATLAEVGGTLAVGEQVQEAHRAEEQQDHSHRYGGGSPAIARAGAKEEHDRAEGHGEGHQPGRHAEQLRKHAARHAHDAGRAARPREQTEHEQRGHNQQRHGEKLAAHVCGNLEGGALGADGRWLARRGGLAAPAPGGRGRAGRRALT